MASTPPRSYTESVKRRSPNPKPSPVQGAMRRSVRRLTEDDVDAAISTRRLATEEQIPFRRALKQLGYEVDSSNHVRKLH